MGLAPDAFVLAVAGNFKRGMAVEPMLRALAQLPDRVHLVFIGGHYQEFATMAQELGVDDRVHVVPPVPPTDIVPLLAEADLAPVPYYPSSISVRHALPNGFFLAVAAGVPVLYPAPPGGSAGAGRALRGGLGDRPRERRVDPIRRRAAPRGARRSSPSAVPACSAVRDELSWHVEEQELARVIAGVLNGREAR